MPTDFHSDVIVSGVICESNIHFAGLSTPRSSLGIDHCGVIWGSRVVWWDWTGERRPLLGTKLDQSSGGKMGQRLTTLAHLTPRTLNWLGLTIGGQICNASIRTRTNGLEGYQSGSRYGIPTQDVPARAESLICHLVKSQTHLFNVNMTNCVY